MKRDPLVTEYRYKSNEAYLEGRLEEAAFWAEKMHARWQVYLRNHPDVARRVREEEREDEARRQELAAKQ